MEKLLITLVHTDNCTYSSEQTLPVFFKSKEEFIITLEDLTQQYIEQCDKFYKDAQKYEKKYEAAREEYSYFMDKQNRSKPNEKTDAKTLQATTAFRNVMEQQRDFTQLNKPKDTFTLGGQTFNFENFTYRDDNDNKKIKMDIPNVFTIDEFFAEIMPIKNTKMRI